MTKQAPLDRLREISRQRTFGRRMPPAAPAEEKAEKKPTKKTTKKAKAEEVADADA